MNISPELLAAGQLIGQVFFPAGSWKVCDDVSRERVLNTLSKNRVSLIFLNDYAKFASEWLALAPGYEQKFIEQQQRLSLVLGHYREVDYLLKQQNIDHLLIKSVGFFPPETSNVDVLVPWAAMPQARESMRALGYLHQRRYVRPDKFLYGKFVGKERVSLIHLHARVSWGPPFLDEKQIWEYCRTSPVGDLYPAPEQSFLITLAHNFYEDSEFDLWDLIKLRLCDPFKLDWDEIFRETCKWGWENGMALSLLILNHAHETLFAGQSLITYKIQQDLPHYLKNWDSTRLFLNAWEKQTSMSMPIVFPKVFTKAHAYLTSLRSKPTSWLLKFKDMALLTRWASETLFGIRVRRPFLIVFCGPDGSGKTTLADGMANALALTGENSYRVWLRAGDSPLLNSLKRFIRPVVKMENEEKPYGGSFKAGFWQNLWLLITTMDWLIRSFFLIRVPLWFHKVIICDRYLLDAIVDISCRSTWEKVNNSKWLRVLVHLAPRPDLGFLTTAPDIVLAQRRPNDLYAIEAQQIYASYRRMKNLAPDLTTIDSTQSETDTLTAVVYKGIEEYYARY